MFLVMLMFLLNFQIVGPCIISTPLQVKNCLFDEFSQNAAFMYRRNCYQHERKDRGV